MAPLSYAAVYDPLFDSSWFKWAQGALHAQALQADFNSVREDPDSGPVRTFRAQYYPNRHGFGLLVTDVSPVPMRWRLRLGDIANGNRAALDHLAWALVSRGRTPPGSGLLTRKQERAVYFPIFNDRSEYNGQLSRYLPGVRRTDAAKVRRRQPYLLPARRRSKHAFALLAAINNEDKHRTVEPIWAHPTNINLEIANPRDCTMPDPRSVKMGARPLEVGAEFAYVPTRKKGPNPQIEVYADITAQIGFRDALSVAEWVNRCGATIWELLIEFSRQPPEITELGVGKHRPAHITGVGYHRSSLVMT